jgi:hypothetical protein
MILDDADNQELRKGEHGLEKLEKTDDPHR